LYSTTPTWDCSLHNIVFAETIGSMSCMHPRPMDQRTSASSLRYAVLALRASNHDYTGDEHCQGGTRSTGHCLVVYKFDYYPAIRLPWTLIIEISPQRSSTSCSSTKMPCVCVPMNSTDLRRSCLSFTRSHSTVAAARPSSTINSWTARMRRPFAWDLSGFGATEMRTEKQRIDCCVLGRAGPSHRVRGWEIRVAFADGFP